MGEKYQYKIGWLGFHQEGLVALKKVLENGNIVQAVITLDKQSAKMRSGYISYDAICEKYKIPLFKIKNINDPDAIAILKNLNLDILCVIGWSQILQDAALQAARLVVGAHASLLPHNRGSAPINWALINGENRTGNTLMVLSDGVDSGDILAQRAFNISLFDSCKTLYDKVASTNAEMLLELLETIKKGKLNPIPQKETDEGILPRRRPHDGLIDWNQDSRTIYNFIRALTSPYPGAFSYIDGQKVTIWKVSWCPDVQNTDVPGSVSCVRYSYCPELCSVVINCLNGTIAIHEVEIENSESLIGERLLQFISKSAGFQNA